MNGIDVNHKQTISIYLYKNNDSVLNILKKNLFNVKIMVLLVNVLKFTLVLN